MYIPFYVELDPVANVSPRTCPMSKGVDFYLESSANDCPLLTSVHVVTTMSIHTSVPLVQILDHVTITVPSTHEGVLDTMPLNTPQIHNEAVHTPDSPTLLPPLINTSPL